MKNFYSYMYYYYFISFFFLLSILMMESTEMTMEWVIFNLHDMKLILSLKFSKENMIFIFTVYSVFASVYYYSLPYMGGSASMARFLAILISFVLSMTMVICSGNLLTTFLGWDGLGVSSMMLIMYYCSNASLKASMFTFMVNRIGDCFFLIFMYLCMCNFPSINLLSKHMCKTDFTLSMCLILIIISITKSAQIPFSSWLTKAMEAPTPVSSLVHSSTLVTAGIFVMFSYKDVWKDMDMVVLIVAIISSSTMLIASMAGLTETDLKKIIAYSTLSQLGFIIFVFSLSLFDQGFFHLITHAFIKSLLFMTAGYIIHHSSGWQDIRYLTLNTYCPNLVKIFIMALLSLSGMMFLSGFYSKDLILDTLMKKNYSLIFLTILMVSFFFTIFYSFRVCWFLMMGMKKTSLISDDDFMMMTPMFYLLFLSCSGGVMILWTMCPTPPVMNSPKIILFSLFFFVLLFFWMSPCMKKDTFFFKTNMFLDVITELIVDKFMKKSIYIMWSSDLPSIMGKFLKMPSNVFLEMTKNYEWKNLFLSMKDFFFFTFLIGLLFGYFMY